MVETRSYWTRRIVYRSGLAACVLLAAAVMASPLAAQETSSVEPNTSPAVDLQALYDQAIEAEWSGDYLRARQLHSQAATLGHGRSHYQLGFLQLDGLGGPRDVEAARHNLRAAADSGITLALVPYLYSFDDQDDADAAPDAFIAARALLELALRDLGMAGDTIQSWSQPMRRQVQVYLRDAGYYRGAIDGLIGQGSLNALRAFARARAPLPELPVEPFGQITLTAQGVRSDDRPIFAFDEIANIVDARSAMAGAQIIETVDERWRIGTADYALLDWMHGSAAQAPVFQLPGVPQGPDLYFGLPFDDVAHDDLGACALRVAQLEQGGIFLRRCEARVAGVKLVFQAQNGPTDDLDAENSIAAAPYGERLVAIELTAPLALRLADN